MKLNWQGTGVKQIINYLLEFFYKNTRTEQMTSSGHRLEFAFAIFFLLSGLLAMVTGLFFIPLAFAVIAYPIYRIARYARKHPSQDKLPPQ